MSNRTRATIPLLAAAALALGASACGTGRTISSDLSSAKVGSRLEHDRDNDSDHNDDDANVLSYGHAAAGRERQALVRLVSSYYAAAAAANGAAACSMLAPVLVESVAEDYGHTRVARGRTCSTVTSKLFASKHRQLLAESASLKLYAVRVSGDRALTALSFGGLPEIRVIREGRYRGRWKMLKLLDGIME